MSHRLQTTVPFLSHPTTCTMTMYTSDLQKQCQKKPPRRLLFLMIGLSLVFFILAQLKSLVSLASTSRKDGMINNMRREEEVLMANWNLEKNLTSTDDDDTDTYTLVLVRCKGNMTWLDEVPPNWRIVVYDKCGKNFSAENDYVIGHTPINAGAEECNGYFDYMYDYYLNLTSVTVFMHDDGILGYGKWSGQGAHTPFTNFSQVVHAVESFLTKDQGFLHFGIRERPEKWGASPYHGEAMKILWPYFAPYEPGNHIQRRKPPSMLSYKSSAHMAVRKEQIQRHLRETYYALIQQVRFARDIQAAGHDYPDSRKFCCAMERMWHIFFGQPAIMPKQAMATDLLSITKCVFCLNGTRSSTRI